MSKVATTLRNLPSISGSSITGIKYLGLASLISAFLALLATPTLATTTRPEFSDFPANVYKGPIAPIKILSHDDAEFRTMLSNAAGQRPNFAGHYTLTSWGCGGNCIITVAINSRTGKTTWLPFTLCCWPAGVDDPREFRSNSRLLVLRGQRNETEPSGTWNVLLENSGFHLLTNGH